MRVKCKIKRMLLSSFLIFKLAQAEANVGYYDYNLNGRDWETKAKWICGTGRTQSPVDINDENTLGSREIFLSGRGY